MGKTYKGFREWDFTSQQREYITPTRLLGEEGELLASGWARRNLFDYDRYLSKPELRRKEWDFYQISNGRYMVQLSFANISLGGYAQAVLVDLRGGKTIASAMGPFLGGKDRYILPARGDAANSVFFSVGGAEFETVTSDYWRTLRFKKGAVSCEFTMDIMEGLEDITTVLPFRERKTAYFMTTKQNSMPTEGVFRVGSDEYRFTKEDTFTVLDWGRVNTPYNLVWYWGNGSAYIYDEEGRRHIFGFEITWGIGDERNATETCLFYDGRAHKIGAVDVEAFPKGRFTEPWKFISEDGRFDLTMSPFYDHHSDLNIGVMRMHSHQVHGLWNGKVTLDDGKELEIRDMYAFCEYVENRW